MSLLNYVKSFEDNENVIVNIDEDIDDDINDLEMDEFFEDDDENESYENFLDMIVEKAKDITDGKYTLEELFKIEPDLDKYIPSDVSQEDIHNSRI